jgi:hypothetical protein
MKNRAALTVQYVLFLLLLPVAAYFGWCTFFRHAPPPLPEDLSRTFNRKSASAHLKELKSLSSDLSHNKSDIYKYIRKDILSRGIRTTEFLTPLREPGREMRNIAAVVPGASQGREMLIVATGYDLQNKRGGSLCSGGDIALTLELSRLFSVKRQGMTIWFLFMDGRCEDGRGSPGAAEKLAEELSKSGEISQLRALISLTLPAGSASDLACRSDSSGDLLNAFKSALLKVKKDYLFRGRTVESSGDFKAFSARGVPVLEILDDRKENTADSSEEALRSLWDLGSAMEAVITSIDSQPSRQGD